MLAFPKATCNLSIFVSSSSFITLLPQAVL